MLFMVPSLLAKRVLTPLNGGALVSWPEARIQESFDDRARNPAL